MNPRFVCAWTLIVAVVLSGGRTWAQDATGTEKTPPKTPQAWTLEQAMQQLRLNPRDVYLQYVVLQLARNHNKADKAAREIGSLTRTRRRRPERRVDLFALFTGALAVQESLQLDAMRERPGDSTAGAGGPGSNVVQISELTGPTVKSHPWGKMLAAQTIAGKRPEVSPLALCVPADQYYVAFRCLNKLLEAAEVGDLWGAHTISQAARSAKTQQTTGRLKTQLAVKTDPLTRPFYDLVVAEVALTGSDLYFREGSDVTVLFRLKQPEVFRLRMDAFLTAAEKSRPDAVRSTGKILGVDYVEVSTPDRAISAFSAYPRADLHVRSNSKAALERVLEAVLGKSDAGRLGELTEFKYIRTLMARGDKREDGFVYLSDPFIRRLVGPQLKLTERRRMLCYNHLRMIGHAAMLYRTQFGKPPESLEQLARSGCAPAVFGRERFLCPCGGKYRLSDDATVGTCSVHGRAGRLVPCCEIPLKQVTKVEAEEHKSFVEQYSRYWRTYFDPIAVRIQLTPERYRAETIILPLIDNTVYTGMAMALGGEPEPLDALPVPKRNIFSMVLRVNKEQLLKDKRMIPELLGELEDVGLKPQEGGVSAEDFLARGIGNQIGMHVCDASPMFDFNMTGFLGEMLGRFRGVGGIDDEVIPVSFLIASLNSPVYLAVPVKDAEVVDGFLDQLDAGLAQRARRPPRGAWFDVDFDFYKVPLEDADRRIRCYCLGLGPVKWRMFFARIDNGLYVASKRFILEDLCGQPDDGPDSKPNGKPDGGPTAHAMVRVRPDHWKEVLPAFQLGWAESSRRACLNNLGPLSSVARAVTAGGDGPPDSRRVHRQADKLHAVHFFCPEGGRYKVSADGRQVTCSVHGTAATPRQPPVPSARSPMGRLIKDFGGLTAELTFLEDGLHAVVTVKRK